MIILCIFILALGGFMNSYRTNRLKKEIKEIKQELYELKSKNTVVTDSIGPQRQKLDT